MTISVGLEGVDIGTPKFLYKDSKLSPEIVSYLNSYIFENVVFRKLNSWVRRQDEHMSFGSISRCRWCMEHRTLSDGNPQGKLHDSFQKILLMAWWSELHERLFANFLALALEYQLLGAILSASSYLTLALIVVLVKKKITGHFSNGCSYNFVTDYSCHWSNVYKGYLIGSSFEL